MLYSNTFNELSKNEFVAMGHLDAFLSCARPDLDLCRPAVSVAKSLEGPLAYLSPLHGHDFVSYTKRVLRRQTRDVINCALHVLNIAKNGLWVKKADSQTIVKTVG